MPFLQDDIIWYIKLQATSFIVYQVAGCHIFLPLSYMAQAAMFSSNKVQAATELPTIVGPVKLSFRISQIYVTRQTPAAPFGVRMDLVGTRRSPSRTPYPAKFDRLCRTPSDVREICYIKLVRKKTKKYRSTTECSTTSDLAITLTGMGLPPRYRL